MTTKDYFDLYFAFEGNVEYHWNFYFILVVACVGWLLSLKRHPGRTLKLLATTGFIVIAGLNMFTLLRNYSFLFAVQAELQAIVQSTSFETSYLKEEVGRLPGRSFYAMLVLGTHLVGNSVILVALWSNRVWEAFRTRRVGTP